MWHSGAGELPPVGSFVFKPVTICASLLCLCACAGAPQTGTGLIARADASQTPAALQRGVFERDLLLNGELQAVRSIAIKSPQTQLFQMRIQFMAEEGTIVKPREPLLSFDSSALAAQAVDLENQILDAETQIVAKRSELASALKDLEIEMAQKRYDYDRTKLEASVDPEVLSRKDHGERLLALSKAEREVEEIQERETLTRDRGQAELDVLMINRDKLQADLRSARNGLELLTIMAPAEGLVVYEKREQSTLRYQEGDSVWPGQDVIKLPDLAAMQVLFHVSEVDAPNLRVGMPVAITLDSFPGRSLTGEIKMIPSMAVKRADESKINIFKVVASLSETWVGEMKPGMSVQGRVVLEHLDGAALVARNAVEAEGATLRLKPRRGQPADASRQFTALSRNATHYLISEDEYARLTGDQPRTASKSPAGKVGS